MMGTRVLLLPAMALMLAACGAAPAAVTGPSQSTMPTPKGFDFTGWTTSVTGTGPQATSANGGLEFSFPASAKGDPQKNDLMAVGVNKSCKLSGDFDLRADFALLQWPARNGVRFGISAGPWSVMRTSNSTMQNDQDNLYFANFSGGLTSTQATGMNGSLRLTRSGTTVTAYYRQDANWVTIATATAATDAEPYSLAAWVDGYTFGHQDVRVNLKNFAVTPDPGACS